jgi:hypothetical protein
MAGKASLSARAWGEPQTKKLAEISVSSQSQFCIKSI